MGKPTKSVFDKLRTKLSKLATDQKIKITKTQVKIDRRVLFKYSSVEIAYTKLRYFPSLKEDIKEEDFKATIILSHQTIQILTGNICNPPKGVTHVFNMVHYLNPDIDHIIIGTNENKIEGKNLYVTYELYSILIAINREEGQDKITRVRNRIAPFLQDKYNLESDESTTERDYGLLLNEIVASRSFSQADIASMTNELESGEINEIVIERQITKQTEWLLDAMQTIVDDPDLTIGKARNFGHDLFGFPKTSISGPEDLMEKILTKYGQHIIFGVPALLNIDKYVISSEGLPRSQFDIILINYLSDIEIIELKRTDEYLLDYDTSRGKFFMSKSLATATAQAERYISAIYKEHDMDLTIDGMSIRDYITSQLGNTITLSICRPKALIIMGAIHRLVRPYEDLSSNIKAKVTKTNYIKNSDTAYKEIRASFKNIDIVTYSELIEGARLRLQLIPE